MIIVLEVIISAILVWYFLIYTPYRIRFVSHSGFEFQMSHHRTKNAAEIEFSCSKRVLTNLKEIHLEQLKFKQGWVPIEVYKNPIHEAKQND